MDVGSLAGDLLAEARRADERRLLVLAGEPADARSATEEVFDGVDVDPGSTTVVGSRRILPCERLDPDRSDHLLGTTRSMVVLDAHDGLRPNALGTVAGAVDGGGLLVLLAPPLEEWPDRRDAFDETMVVDPYDLADVTGHFRRRLVGTLRDHPGVAVVDLAAGRVEADGLTDPPLLPPRADVEPPERGAFPAAAYEACLTRDQARAVAAFEAFHPYGRDRSEEYAGAGWSGTRPEDGNGTDEGDDAVDDEDGTVRAIVLEADRGRGKSSAAGLAAACLSLTGEEVLVTAPEFRSAREAFARARELLATVEMLAAPGPSADDVPRVVECTSGGAIRFRPPSEAVDRVGDADVVIVDEAAALPVERLTATLAADRVAYATTVHGYEGAGRGFSVRFRDRLAGSRHDVADVTLTEPIRYAPGDPVESWAFHALVLDARPPVEPLVEDATPETVEYRRLDPAELVGDEHLLREVFGLLVLAHYRTEPDDLARLLDAPNLRVRALTHDGRVVSVALLAREGGLTAERRADIYEGERIRGHMLPDALTSQLRDERAGIPVGWRVMRIATHHAVRSRGLGSHLLARVREEVASEGADWLGVGYGATARLVRFWAESGFRTVHLSTTRNERSGEHSAFMFDPITDAGRELCDRHARWLVDRVDGMLGDSLSSLDPDVVREALRATGVEPEPELPERDWRVVAGAAYGPGIYAVDPAPFRSLAIAGVVDPDDPLTVRQERLLVATVLQTHPLDDVAERMGFHSVGTCLRAIGDAYRPLVDRYGDDVALAERDRFEE